MLDYSSIDVTPQSTRCNIISETEYFLGISCFFDTSVLTFSIT